MKAIIGFQHHQRPGRGPLWTERRSAPHRRHRDVVWGLLAGAAGTAAMDTLLYFRYRRAGGSEGPLEWEFSSGVDSWDDVSAPGLVGKRVLKGILRREAPDHWARSTQNIMHWATGMGWSAEFGLISGSANRRSWTGGLVLGPVVWLSGYVVLPLANIYQPIWDYDTKTLAKDLSAHVVYGATTGAAFAALAKVMSLTTRDLQVA